ncbi:MAG: AgmX/PglI C-terminal domain-containing protein [Gammaproteobacteria bacterium]|nr:AgmX/PglI C-terminal domain-containing protein [Gammaproteobacteria bacterium]
MSEAIGDNKSEREVSEDRLTEAELAADRKALTDEQYQEQLRLDELDAAVCAAEDELVEHMALRGNFDLLEQACQKLEKLSELGIAELFWGEDMPSVTADAHLADALARIDEFYARLKYLEDQHQAALGNVEGQRETLDILDYELYQAEQREESRKQEWIVERDPTILESLRLAMPWMRGFEDDKLFRKTLAGSVLAGLLLGLIIPLIDLPIPEREELTEVPERFAKLIRKEPVAPPPPRPVREKAPEETPEEVDPEQIVEPEPEPKVAAEATPKPEAKKDKIKSVGILAFRENFSNLTESKPAARLGSMARVTDAGKSAVGRPERAMVTTQGSGSSGGINLAAISRDINGGGVELVEGVQLSQVESGIDGGGAGDRPRSAGGIAGRTDEEIQIVFDRYKAALYRLYNRELRKDPTLRGQMVLRLTIEPDGSVSLCNVQASDMQAPDLAQRVVNSVTGFQFGAKAVPAITILYPIDFLPTA